MIRTLCEMFHSEASSFHLPVRGMTITLDDVSNLLHVPIKGRSLDFEKKVSREHGVSMMTRYLGMSAAAVAKACKAKYGAHLTFVALKRLYEDHLIVARQLDVPQSREELKERDRRREWCVRSFLIYLVGCTLFTNKTDKHTEVINLECMVDLTAMNRWLWGGMKLAHLYHYLTDSVQPRTKTMSGCVTLLMVINSIMFIYLIRFFFLCSSI